MCNTCFDGFSRRYRTVLGDLEERQKTQTKSISVLFHGSFGEFTDGHTCARNWTTFLNSPGCFSSLEIEENDSTNKEETTRGRNETKSSSGQVVPAKQNLHASRSRTTPTPTPTSTRMSTARRDVLPVRPAVLPKSWRAEKLFIKARGKERRKGTLCDSHRFAHGVRFPFAEKTVSILCIQASFL